MLPTKAKSGDAGFDLVAVSCSLGIDVVSYTIGLAVEIPPGYAGFIFPRSSLSKTGLILANSVGIIDSGYRGEFFVKFYYGTSTLETMYKMGDRIAQLIILPVPDISYEFAEELSESERSTGGFGHTGN